MQLKSFEKLGIHTVVLYILFLFIVHDAIQMQNDLKGNRMQSTGKIEAILIKEAHGKPMRAQSEAVLQAGKGLFGNIEQGDKRQVTILSLESWRDTMRDLHTDLDPSTRRANIVVSGIDLCSYFGKVLQIGSCRLQIFGESKPCAQMEAAHPGLRAAMSKACRGGIYGEVVLSGSIRIGDLVRWLE